jgi:hypothetical protein
MKVSSKKQKARLLQQKIVSEILNLFPELTSNDVRSTPMGVTGADIQLSEKARVVHPYSYECKSHARYAVYKDYEQSQTAAGNLNPILVIKQNNSTPLVILSLENWCKLIKESRHQTESQK